MSKIEIKDDTGSYMEWSGGSFMTDDIPVRAFPSNAIHPKFGGMTLLEFYAGQALPAVISAVMREAPDDASPDVMEAAMVRMSFSIAKAMMTEREKCNGS